MNKQTKLLFAVNQIENVIKLVEHNEFEQYLTRHLIVVKSELQRQLTNLTQSTTIKE